MNEPLNRFYVLFHSPSKSIFGSIQQGAKAIRVFTPADSGSHEHYKHTSEYLEKRKNEITWMLRSPSHQAISSLMVLLTNTRPLKGSPHLSPEDILESYSLTEFLQTTTGRAFTGRPKTQDRPKTRKRPPRLHDVREEVLRLYDQGFSQRAIAEKLNSSKTTIGRWLKELSSRPLSPQLAGG